MRRGNYIEPEERKYLSTEGYRANSPDRNRPMNIINSNEISMEDVNHRVLGIDDEDNEIVMDPGKRYKFPGTKVYEFPIPNIEPAGYQRLPSLTTNPQYQNRSRLNVSPYGFIDAWDNNIVPNLGIDADYNVNPNLNVGFRGLGMRNVMTPGDGTLRNDFQFNYPSGYVRATIPYRDKRKNLPKHQLHGIVPKQKPVAPRAMDMTPEEFHQMQAVQKAKNKTPKTTYGHISQEERNRLRTEAEVNAKQKWNSENITPKSETFTKADFIEQKKREFKSNPKPFMMLV